jgi:prophage regulatory protein
MSNTVLRLPAVKSRIGLSRSMIYDLVSKGSFPSPISLGPRAVGWLESEVDAWLSRRIQRSRATQGKNKVDCGDSFGQGARDPEC